MITTFITDLSPAALLLAKATLVMLLACACVVAMRNSTAARRHLLLASLFLFLLLLPFGSLLLPGIRVEVARQPVGTATTPATAAAPSEAMESRRIQPAPAPSATQGDAPPSRSRAVVVSLYAAGVLVLLLQASIGAYRLRAMRRRGIVWVKMLPELDRLARREGVRRPVNLVLSSAIATPVTYGFINPTILLPEDCSAWDGDDLHRALTHEVEHIRRADWLSQLLCRFVCAVYWFHPLAWVAARRLSLEAEKACDDAVLRRDAIPDSYAEQLVSLARRLQRSGNRTALAMAGRSLLFARVHSILNRQQSRTPLSSISMAVAVMVTMTALLVVAPLKTVAAAPDPDVSFTSEVPPASSAVLDAAMIEAAQRGDLATIDRLLEIGVSPDATVHGDGSPLIAAARKGRRELVDQLLDRGASIDHGVSGDGNPLIVAAAAGHLEVARALLDRGADIEAIVPSDENALIQASQHGHIEVVRLLLERGANVNSRDGSRTPLRMARSSGHVEIVRLLTSAGATD